MQSPAGIQILHLQNWPVTSLTIPLSELYVTIWHWDCMEIKWCYGVSKSNTIEYEPCLAQ
jgi:hypothetical protein